MSINWNDVGNLLHIADLANKWPKLRAIHDAALRELDKHSEVAAKDNEEAAKAKAKAKAEAEAKAKITEETRKQQEEEAKAEEGKGELKRRTLSE